MAGVVMTGQAPVRTGTGGPEVVGAFPACSWLEQVMCDPYPPPIVCYRLKGRLVVCATMRRIYYTALQQQRCAFISLSVASTCGTGTYGSCDDIASGYASILAHVMRCLLRDPLLLMKSREHTFVQGHPRVCPRAIRLEQHTVA